jgi:peptidyl-tRNA hydrolase, PTH1 family
MRAMHEIRATIPRMSWVVIGLGNPGEAYAGTRHNAGRMALEFFAKKHGASAWKPHKASESLTTGATVGKQIAALVLPETFMNKSGVSAAKFVKSVKAAEKCIVVYDDLDLPLGTIKLSFDRGSGGHKGVESIMRALKTKKFIRIRIGVCPTTVTGKMRKPEAGEEVNTFILKTFKEAEMDELKKVFKKVSEAIETTLAEGREIAMNRFN